MEIEFEVLGTPQPQGSVRAFTPKGWSRPVLTSTNKNLKPFRQEVAAVARQVIIDKYGPHAAAPVLVGKPVSLTATFYFQKPKSVKIPWKITKPDLDKLMRAIGDALTGIVYKDDSQIINTLLRKRFGSPDRVHIHVMDASSTPLDKE